VYSVTETSEIVQLSTPESGVASSTAADLAYIQEEEDLQENEDVELRIRPTATNAQEAQSDGAVLEKERLLENTSDRETEEAVWAMGEVHLGNEESADGPTTPFPVLGVVAESTDELMTPLLSPFSWNAIDQTCRRTGLTGKGPRQVLSRWRLLN